MIITGVMNAYEPIDNVDLDFVSHEVFDESVLAAGISEDQAKEYGMEVKLILFFVAILLPNKKKSVPANVCFYFSRVKNNF